MPRAHVPPGLEPAEDSGEAERPQAPASARQRSPLRARPARSEPPTVPGGGRRPPRPVTAAGTNLRLPITAP